MEARVTRVSGTGIAPAEKQFEWSEDDVSSMLPHDWKQQIMDVAHRFTVRRVLVPPHSTSREDPSVTSLPVHGVKGRVVHAELPWLVELYRGPFRELGQRRVGKSLATTADQRYGIVLNVQLPGERYECHVDTNPVEGLLYVTNHPEGHGGELVVANNVNADSVEKVDADCTILYPKEGHLFFFDGRFNPHYVRPLIKDEIRVAVAMNFYTDDVPETTRPEDLNEYLYGPEV
ncbi:MAG TPA: 2OG-Fe(II) oxygenase [Actinophytocola sp.]|uniref:2OG-Fe(II) oxygenase n=1 Tax=Actinophytocola sp. TaxID=1872138 RepID=UPI002DDCF79C|nr:2OG-Fe(II) oxygenase [Actinophytocola sp.]HEV2778602.1 2OG-Fe(II) oxygenase [Actinophytocola sp.]